MRFQCVAGAALAVLFATSLAAQEETFSVQKAQYGIPGHWLDVTQKIKDLIKSDQEVKTTDKMNTFFKKDPAAGRMKTLAITFKVFGGAPMTQTIDESSMSDFQDFLTLGRVTNLMAPTTKAMGKGPAAK